MVDACAGQEGKQGTLGPAPVTAASQSSELSPYLCCLQMRALAKKSNKTEKLKNAKGGHQIWTEIGELGALIRWGLCLCLCNSDVLAMACGVDRGAGS